MDVQKGLTWLKEFLHSLVEMNSRAGGPNNLAIPICVTTRHTCMDLKCTASQQAQAVSLPMPLLTLEETYAVRAWQISFLTSYNSLLTLVCSPCH